MLDADLARMANQVAFFFAGFQDSEAIEGVRDHLTKFWTPAMRRQLKVLYANSANSEHELHQLVQKAIPLLN